MAFHFRAILMNVKPLLKYFPEIHHLPADEQLRLLQRAYDQAFGPENKLQIWRKNLVGFALLIAVCGLIIAVAGPMLSLAPSSTGIILMVIIFPLFIVLQQRRYIAQLRPVVHQLLHKATETRA